MIGVPMNIISIVLSIIVLLVHGILLYKNNKNRFVKSSLIVWAILMVLEVSLFNFRFYESRNYEEQVINDYSVCEGLEIDDEGTVTIAQGTRNCIEIIDLNKELHDIYIDLDSRTYKGEKLKNQVIWVAFGYTDAANSKYKYTQTRSILASKDKGEIIKFNLAGKSSKLRVYFNGGDDQLFAINKIILNKKYNFNYSIIRMLSIYFVFLLWFLVGPKAKMWKLRLNDSKAKKYIIGALVFELCLFIFAFSLNGYFVKEDFGVQKGQRDQYKYLAESFSHGHLYLEEEPSELLQSMKNPYDTKKRDDLFKDSDEVYLWDCAYYKGKYYVYFGVAPVIFYYLPHYLIFKTHIKTSTCIFITGIFTTIAVLLFMKRICKMWFKNDVNLGLFIIIFLMFINGCGILHTYGRPDHYYLPILMGVMFSLYGLIAWLKASETDKTRYYFLGSLCMALVAACRPQLLLTSFLAIPIFWKKIKEIFKKENLSKVIAFVMPYVVVAGLLMVYNYLRFGSVTDFGANYNLTTNDMTKRGWVMERIPSGLFYYFLNTPEFSVKFPFILRTDVVNNYIGTTIFESMPAGFFWSNALCILGLFIYKIKNRFKKNKLPYILSVMLLAFAFIISVVDTEMAGILPRYILDFGFMIYTATVISSFKLEEELTKSNLRLSILRLIFIATIISSICFLLTDTTLTRYMFYYQIRQIFEFWV